MEPIDVISLSDAGQLTRSGTLANSADDVQRLFAERIPALTSRWKKLRIAFYIHGGLVSEESALANAAEFWTRCIPAEIYPVSIIWHTDYWSTVVRSMFSVDAMRSIARNLPMLVHKRSSEVHNSTAMDGMAVHERTPGRKITDYTDSLIEIVARFGTGKLTWDLIKENAFLAGDSPEGGAHPIAAALKCLLDKRSVEIHVVGHSAGGVFAAPFLQVLSSLCTATTCSLWAPACTCDVFEHYYVPLLTSDKVGTLNLFTLSPEAELSDNILHLYRKSTLYLISNAYEQSLALSCGSSIGEPLLGMACFAKEHLRRGTVGGELLGQHRIRWSVGPNELPLGSIGASRARGHLAFPQDDATLQATMACILEGQ
jgi:hypothetical protein